MPASYPSPIGPEVETKLDEHHEEIATKDLEHLSSEKDVQDDVAGAYLDHSVEISPEENIRLRRRLYWR